jgi:predicted ATPase
MITELEIKNYKSIRALTLPLGRVNVFIGENGAGKSNILEVIALAAAAAADKLDHEFLSSRGIRVTSPEFMRPAFPDADPLVPIEIAVKTGDDRNITFQLNNDNTLYSKWKSTISAGYGIAPSDEFKSALATLTDSDAPSPVSIQRLIKAAIENINPATDLPSFVIFSPENSSLRTFDREGQIEPLGINGEGLLKLLSFHASKPNDTTLAKVKESLKLFDWFDDFVTESVPSEARLLVRDRYLDDNLKGFDHRSANEGFFFLLFYFLLFNSELTPKFFAVDNIDASLNPKLCEKLVQELSALAKANDKQAILTTHNPAVLDGLDLNDDEQRLFVVSRQRSSAFKNPNRSMATSFACPNCSSED